MGAAAVDDLVEIEHVVLRRHGLSPVARAVALVKPGAFAYLATMALRSILIHPDPRLRKTVAPVETVDAALRALADDMLETMYDAPGIGLAATQIGVMKRLFVMDCASKDEPAEPTVIINPEILWTSEETVISEEGCLSIPEVYEDVTRHARLRLGWTDLEGARQEREFADRRAVCIQHEIDHLQGRLFIDYLGAVRRTMITARMKKLKREKARA
jgi:peptide deformylase